MIPSHDLKLKPFSQIELGELFLFRWCQALLLAIGVEGNNKGNYAGFLSIDRGGSSEPYFLSPDATVNVLSLGRNFYLNYDITSISAEITDKCMYPLEIDMNGNASLRFKPFKLEYEFDPILCDLKTGMAVSSNRPWFINEWSIWASESDYKKSPNNPLFSSSEYQKHTS